MKKTNAERFIAAYNSIDYSLRTIYDFKRSMTFSDVVRRSVVLNSIVRKYEEELIDYGRLRNAIIHQGNKKYVIAEPHDEVVAMIEKLASLISEPPLAIDRIGNSEVITIQSDLTIDKAMELIYRTGYSNLPIYENNKLVGVLNGRKIINVIGQRIQDKQDINRYITKTTVGEIIQDMGEDYYYLIADENLTIDEAMNSFENNRKLLVILIMREGKVSSKPLKIITLADIIDMKKILDVY